MLISSLPQAQPDAKRSDQKRSGAGAKSGAACGFFAPRTKNQENSESGNGNSNGSRDKLNPGSPVTSHRTVSDKYKNGNISLKPNGRNSHSNGESRQVPRYEPVRRAPPEHNKAQTQPKKETKKE